MAGLAVVGRRGVGCQCAHGGGRARPAGAGRWQRAASGYRHCGRHRIRCACAPSAAAPWADAGGDSR
ncbi:hypothetical protein G6F66_015736 [Rhizopus arrhizus]|nr:hypothetical protein G6F66_015736 [Rhizopus arrhizus]